MSEQCKLIILDNKYCQLVTEDASILRLLRSHLSYRVAGVEYTAAYQNGWDGVTYLVSKKGIFLSGLLPKAQKFLANKKINFIIEDKRNPINYNKELDLTDKLQKLSLVPYDHQRKIIEVAAQNEKGIIRAATGSGKSQAIAMLIAKLNKPVIVYVIGLDLLGQFHDLFSQIFDEKIGYIGNGICQVERINIASIWTIGRSLQLSNKDIISDEECDEEQFNESQSGSILEMLKKSQVHIFDESHVVTTNTINCIHKNIDPERIYGFSGTPFRDDNTELLINGLLGEQLIDISASELIEKGLLAQPIIKFVAVPKMSTTNLPYQTVYKNYVVENEARNNLIASKAKELIDKKYTPLVLFKQIKHGEILFEKMQKLNIKCALLCGNDSLEKRNEIKQKLINKEINLIIASTIFDIGLNLPELSALILASGGRSNIKTLQRVGRAVRAYPGKTHVAVVDFYDQVKYLKKHSLERYGIYSSEKGFKIIKCREMK